jgi:hypothetical protein
LGSGIDAPEREGIVLLAPVEEYHHFLRQAAVFIYAIGEDDDSVHDELVIRGVIIDHPTPFTMKEMMMIPPPDHQDDPSFTTNTTCVYDNFIFRGGDTGGESAFCLHSIKGLTMNEIGTSGIYQGGDIANAFDNHNNNKDSTNHDQVKFFFNYMEFTEQELEDMLNVTYQDGDAWISVQVPPELVLRNDYRRGEAWARLRNAIREEMELLKRQIQRPLPPQETKVLDQ